MNTLSSQMKVTSCRYRLDSKIALFWLNNADEWNQFARQRVTEILQKSERSSWGNCPEKENPTDIGSRGLEAGKLKNNQL